MLDALQKRGRNKRLVCDRQVLGVYLVWRGAAPGLRVYVDFTFTLLNREHFSTNEGFSGKRVKFTYEAPAQGNRNYISVAELYSRNFADSNGEFQLELTMANVRTVFTSEVRLSSSMFVPGASKPSKLETSYFTFGGFDWNLVVYPHGNKEAATSDTSPGSRSGSDSSGTSGRLSVHLIRLTGFDHRCRVRYVVSLGEGDRRIESGPLEDISDDEGRGLGWQPRVRWSDVAHKNVLRLSLEMLEARTVSEVAVQALGPGSLPATPCYDRDKQAWALRADLHSDLLRLHLVYKDIHNVPRNHLKFVSWTAYLIRGEEPNAEIMSLPGAPFSRYYAQEPADEGIIMETSIGVGDVKDESCPFVTDKGQIRVRLEWNESHMLFQATYHKYDDVCRIHNQQMRREIAALQSENYSLERQLFNYQRDLAIAQARQQEPEAGSTHHSSNRNSSHHLERSASTDTEYA
ncbi:hypothetical protein QAD02_001633 [Eretmocerus hayati]|uniref:Uncharacterized protein n=1 Tax=Eretmocerus hayati TaxID=131215 RepID=A0ACC2NGJ4_9HYME|nr:hypothetical protein QAD02_001633 [Eretmocerus hayati]